MEQNLNFKTIKISSKKSYDLIRINSNLLIVTYSDDKIEKYILVPKEITIKKGINTFLLSSESLPILNIFAKSLEGWLNSLSRPFRKKLILKGLGYKASLIDNNKCIELKLGFSHSSIVSIPKKNVTVKINKNIVSVEGFNRSEVGNFTGKIRHLKVPDDYKGKGIWYQNENKQLKELKKK